MSRPGSAIPPDTIVAIATPPGAGALGVVRLSGPGAVALADRVLRLRGGRPLGDAAARVLHRATVLEPGSGAVVDEVLVARMPAPRSYTGEDVVELSCHGSPLLLARIVALLTGAGARVAAPGEFTRRAYLNGRMDLLQAEAVAALIGARSDRAVRLAARELAGGLGRAIGELRERLLDLVAGLEVALDFPEEEVGPPRVAAAEAAGGIAAALSALIEGAERGRVVQDGLMVMLTGAPNVGKSSLLNRLLGHDRAIVAAEAGTTRDLIEATLVLAGVPVRLVDGAGLGEARDAIDAEAMRRARQALDESDLLLVVIDASRSGHSSDRAVVELTEGRPRLLVGNKADRGVAWAGPPAPDVVCSALSGTGVGELRARLERRIGVAVPDGDESAVLASVRVIESLRAACGAVATAGAALAATAPLELPLVDLRAGLDALDAGLGVRVEDAVLDRVFARFCVGK